jgi:hypothetical protein
LLNDFTVCLTFFPVTILILVIIIWTIIMPSKFFLGNKLCQLWITLEAEMVPEMLGCYQQLTRLVAWQEFIEFS